MNIQLSDHFTYEKLLRFTIPSIAMLIVTSVYGVVDGLFVSNIVGKEAFAAVNLIYPFIAVFGAVGFMFGTGGSALVAKTFGEQKPDQAKQIFTMLIVLLGVLGILCAAIGIYFLRAIASAFGAEGQLLEYCVQYGRIILSVLPAFMLQTTFQTFFITAEKPHLGLIFSLASGVTNVIFDFLFIYVFSWGITGAAAATGMSQLVGGVIPLFYFGRQNSSILRFVRFHWDLRAIFHACSNGLSEMVSNLSFSLMNMLYNYQLMRFFGPDGVSAYGIIMYVAFIFDGVYMGYSIGCAPVISYHYGAQNRRELQNLFKKSNILICIFAVVLTGGAELTAAKLTGFFVGYDAELLALSTYALRAYSICYLLCGLNIFASSLFTALNNGPISAFISGVRMLVFESSMVVLIPMLVGMNGIWFAVTVAEILALTMNICIYRWKNKEYGFLPERAE